MNLSGIFNHSELNRSQGAGQTQALQSAANPSSPAASQPNGGRTDQAHLSAGALAAAAQSTESGSSDVRFDKVASVSAALQAGTYNVSAYHVADKIMQGMFENGSR